MTKEADSKMETKYTTTMRVIKNGVVVEEEKEDGEQRNND